MHAPVDAAPAVPLRAWILFLVVALAGQAWLLANPGYFSHDELQWAVYAGAQPLSAVDWQGPGDWRAFQFRPLALDLWMLMLRALFATPWAMHAAFVALGTVVGAGLLALLVRLRVAPVVATVFALAFVLGPVAAYTHGWVATLADLLWVGLGMLGANLVLRWSDGEPRAGTVAAGVALLTILALLAKEAAVVLPALAALAWLLSGRRRAWAVATVASGVPVGIYFALRVAVILYTPRPEGVYAWSVLSVPTQWLAYQVFPLEPSVFEVGNALAVSGRHLGIVIVLLAAMWALVARAHWRAAAWGLAGGAFALGPVLLLQSPANHYAYAQSAVVAGALAVAWPRLRLAGRCLVGFVLLVTLWHGANVARQVHRVGVLQARFSPALAAAVAQAGGAPVRVRLPEQDTWAYVRLSHEIPAYAGVPIGERLVVVMPGDPAPVDYTVDADGGLRPAR
jgi:hypothetical protein